jgi:hypothetical protein
MALTKQTIVDSIAADRDGNLSIRLALEVYDNDELLTSTYHRVVVGKEEDINLVFANINTDLVSRRRDPVSPGDITKMGRIQAIVVRINP